MKAAAAGGDRRAPVLVALGFALLLAAWVMGNPLTAAPDEPVNYYKALGAAHGQWRGEPVTVPPGLVMTPHDRLLAELTRVFRLPPAYALQTGAPGQRLECVAFSPASASCQDVARALPPVSTPVPLPGRWDGPPPLGPPPAAGVFPSYVGGYPPFVYLPMGLAARVGGGGELGLRLARAASAVLTLLLLFGAARCCRSQVTRVGLLTAVTPMVVFLGATVTASGMEIAAGVCVAAAGLAILRGQPGSEPWAWLTAAGVVLGLSRVLGPGWLVFYALLLAAVLGPRALRPLLRRRRKVVACGVTLFLTFAVGLAWNAATFPREHARLSTVIASLGPAVGHLPALLDESVGRFGWIDTPLPPGFAPAAHLALAGLLGLALWVGTMRQRLLLVGLVLAVAAATVGVEAFTQTPFGYVSQARYTMPVGVAVPLLAAHVLDERCALLPPRALRGILTAAASVAVILQAVGWYAAAQHAAVGLGGGVLFFRSPQWAPPGGWYPWILCVLLGTALLGLAARRGVEAPR